MSHPLETKEQTKKTNKPVLFGLSGKQWRTQTAADRQSKIEGNTRRKMLGPRADQARSPWSIRSIAFPSWMYYTKNKTTNECEDSMIA